jgi:hypothetical protein
LQVARINHLPQAELEDFLFGAQRIALSPVKTGLRELAHGRCFYCAKPVTGTGVIDHFLPWSRYIDNGIENLVYADAKCNSDKREYLAAARHVERWGARMTRPQSRQKLLELAAEKKWESHPDKTRAVARSIYLGLPSDYELWELDGRFTPAEPARLRQALVVG